MGMGIFFQELPPWTSFWALKPLKATKMLGFIQSLGVQKHTRPSAGVVSLPETNSEFTPESRPGLKKETIVFQPSIFRCELFVFGGCRSSIFVVEGICCPKVWLSLQSIFQIPTVAPYVNFWGAGPYWIGDIYIVDLVVTKRKLQHLGASHSKFAANTPILLTEGILNHLGCIKPVSWDKLPTSTGDRRISEPSTVASKNLGVYNLYIYIYMGVGLSNMTIPYKTNNNQSCQVLQVVALFGPFLWPFFNGLLVTSIWGINQRVTLKLVV